MELRDKIRITFVIASISTAFMPWLSVSLFGFTLNVSLLNLIYGFSGSEMFSLWTILGVAYLLASLLLIRWDKAPYVQMAVLILMPVSCMVVAGDVEAVISLLGYVTGMGGRGPPMRSLSWG